MEVSTGAPPLETWLRSPTAGWDRSVLIRSFRGTVCVAPKPPDPVCTEIQPGAGLLDRWGRRRALTLPCPVERCSAVVVRVKRVKSAAATTSMSGLRLATSPVRLVLLLSSIPPRRPRSRIFLIFSRAGPPALGANRMRAPASVAVGAELCKMNVPLFPKYRAYERLGASCPNPTSGLWLARSCPRRAACVRAWPPNDPGSRSGGDCWRKIRTWPPGSAR